MGLAVFAFSTSSIFVRLAIPPLHVMTFTMGRMLLGSLTVIAMSLVFRGVWKSPPREQWPKYLLFGFIAAAHFVFYIAALSYTSIAHALSITYTAPIWVTLFSRLFLGEPFPSRKWPGIFITIIGIAILAGFEPALDWRMLLGDLLALGSAVCFGLYSVAGRSQRDAVPLFSYAATVYGIAGIWLLAPGLCLFEAKALTWKVGVSVLGASIIPLGIGHTLYNAALRKLHPTLVNILATQEVTGGVLLGILLLAEIPTPGTLVGAGIALAGVIWTLL